VEIVASSGRLYQRQAGKVLEYQGVEQGWEVIGEDPDMAQIVADEGVIYERQKSGRVFMSVGNPVQGTSKSSPSFTSRVHRALALKRC
jgi:hypothetical protein